MEKQRKMSVQECRESLLMTGAKCRSKFHMRKDRCQYCEVQEWGVGMSCPTRELMDRERIAEFYKAPYYGGHGLDVFTVAAMNDKNTYKEYFGEDVFYKELAKDRILNHLIEDYDRIKATEQEGIAE